MHSTFFSSTFAALLLASATQASPIVPVNGPSLQTLHPRQDPLQGSTCVGFNTGFDIQWAVYIPGQMLGNDNDGWAGGFLDNLRGQAGVISGWQAAPDGPGTGIVTSFATTVFASSDNVHDAAWLASNPNVNIQCSIPESFDDFKTQAGNIYDIAQIAKGVVTFVSDIIEAIEAALESA